MFPPRKLTLETVHQVTNRVWLTKPRPNVHSQMVSACLRMEDGTFISFTFLDLDDKGIYSDNGKAIGAIDDPCFIEYLQKISKPPAEEDAELFAHVCESYAETKSIKKTAKHLSVSEERVRRILITEGKYTCAQYEKITGLLNEGKTIEEISVILGMSPKQIKTYLPYKKDYE